MASQSGPPRKPRLSLQIKSTQVSSVPRPPRGFVSSRDPTSFNTLSNVYVTAIERSAQPQGAEPLTAINTLQAFSIASPVEQGDYKDLSHRVITPFVANYPGLETPISATCASPRQMEMRMFPSVMTATPPLSAGPMETDATKPAFSFSEADVGMMPAPVAPVTPIETRNSRRRVVASLRTGASPPYDHPRSLHSILRNSPLPPRTAIPPPSPRRQSLRLAEKAARRVAYNNPLTQDIITNKYTKSHIDLLCEEPSPLTPSKDSPADQKVDILDVALKLTANEIQDGGQTPGPFEDMRRRMAGLVSNTPTSASTPTALATPLTPSGPTGVRKRKKKEKKRQWRWTIGPGAEDENDDDDISGAEAASRAASSIASSSKFERAKSEDDMRTPLAIIPHAIGTVVVQDADVPTPTIEKADSVSADDSIDVVMSESDDLFSSRATSVDEGFLVPSDVDMDGATPTGPKPPQQFANEKGTAVKPKTRDTPIPELAGKGDTPLPELVAQRDTPIPPEYYLT